MSLENHIILTVDEQEVFDSWTKEQIYEAYIAEREARLALNIELNKTNRLLAEIKFMATR